MSASPWKHRSPSFIQSYIEIFTKNIKKIKTIRITKTLRNDQDIIFDHLNAI